MCEGYLVLIGGLRFDPDAGHLSPEPFREVFHRKTACIYTWAGRALPTERLSQLCTLVRDVPYWHHSSVTDSARDRLEFDHNRLSEVCEAWIPVCTPDGEGVLLFPNCD
jgi:hypothetical protein